MKHQIEIPDNLASDTKRLVLGFAEALAAKLHAAEEKYGYDNGWMRTRWVKEGRCRQSLMEHIDKGDPRDVAAYCAFLWHHGASTRDPDLDHRVRPAFDSEKAHADAGFPENR